MSDRLRMQYADDRNLQTRITLHERFSLNRGWQEWLFERELGVGPAARILDLGCGPGTLWKVNRDRVDASWALTLADFSSGMLDVARTILGDGARYVVADAAEDLPFADASFDVVLANFMLYHVPDRRHTLAEARRVLAPDGRFHAATNGRRHFAEVRAIMGDRWPFSRHMELFGLESGPAQLEPLFIDVSVDVFENELRLTEVEPLLVYIRSSSAFDGGDLEEVRSAVEDVMARDGFFRISTTPCVVSGRRP